MKRALFLFFLSFRVFGLWDIPAALIYGLFFIVGGNFPQVFIFVMIYLVVSIQYYHGHSYIKGLDVKQIKKRKTLKSLFLENWDVVTGATLALSILFFLTLFLSSLALFVMKSFGGFVSVSAAIIYGFYIFFVFLLFPAAMGEVLAAKSFEEAFRIFFASFFLEGIKKRYLFNRNYFSLTTFWYPLAFITKMVAILLMLVSWLTFPLALFLEYWLIVYSALVFAECYNLKK